MVMMVVVMAFEYTVAGRERIFELDLSGGFTVIIWRFFISISGGGGGGGYVHGSNIKGS